MNLEKQSHDPARRRGAARAPLSKNQPAQEYVKRPAIFFYVGAGVVNFYKSLI